MTWWFLIALLAPALWAAANHIDKYLLGQYFKEGGEGALIIFSSLIGLIFLPILAYFHPGFTDISLTKGLLQLAEAKTTKEAYEEKTTSKLITSKRDRRSPAPFLFLRILIYMLQ